MADAIFTRKSNRPHHDRLAEAREELQNITEILSRLTGNGEGIMESCVKWFIPKLDAVSETLDEIEADMEISTKRDAA